MAAGLLVVAVVPLAHATIYGTMSNFDTYNTTPEPSEGAEIELEGCHASEIANTFPAHYNNMTIAEYVNGATFGTRITFEDYNFDTTVTHGSLNPNPNPVSTNGHALVYTDSGEHFGFAVTSQPTASRFYWLNRLDNGTYERIGAEPVAIPNPSWTYVPPVGGGAPHLQAEVQVPEEEFEVQKPDSIWMKVYKTELNRSVELGELMSGDEPGNIVPQDDSELETEWELLEGGKLSMKDDKIKNNSKSVVRRYEFFEYTGLVDDENEPISAFLDQDLVEPPAGELGNFIAANMVAANLVAAAPGDFNLDGAVDGFDFLKWQLQVGTEGHQSADGSDDGVVDELDRDIWSGAFAHGGAVAGVPEPTSAALLIVGTALAAMRLKRRGAQVV